MDIKSSEKGPLKDVGNQLQPPSQKGQKAAWKLPISSWASSSAKQGGLSGIDGGRTPPLFDVSFSACPEEQCVTNFPVTLPPCSG